MTDRRLPPRALHVTNGDITVRGLFDAGIEGPIEPWRDVLHEGPVPAVADDELRRIRARFLAAEDAGDIGTASELARRDDVLAAHRDGHYVLWFEADLYDQLQLVQILARLRELAVPPGRITLLCIGEHVGVARFGGLGELSSEQLAALPERVATTLGPEALAHAARAWDALRAPDPAGVEAIARVAPPSELRFVAEAFDRLGREYPSTRDGLALSERRILAAVAQGAGTASEAFVRAGDREPRPFLGDTWAFARMTRLAGAPVPLLETDPADGRVAPRTRLRLTAFGRRVLAGEADHVADRGVDRWIGGVHLQGRAVPWRWDEGTEAIVASAG